jgi:hypothetical protein
MKILPELSQLQWIQGGPPTSGERHPLHLSLIIQPNCPGCHTHALASLIELHRWWLQQGQQLERLADEAKHEIEASDGNEDVMSARARSSLLSRISYIYCVSTAFEDFELNTVESTRGLLEGKTVGATRWQIGPVMDPNTIPPASLPVAYDNVTAKDETDASVLELALAATRSTVQHQLQHTVSPNSDEMYQILSRVRVGMLPQAIAHYFYACYAQGTPTWVLSCSTASGRSEDAAKRMDQASVGAVSEATGAAAASGAAGIDDRLNSASDRMQVLASYTGPALASPEKALEWIERVLKDHNTG